MLSENAILPNNVRVDLEKVTMIFVDGCHFADVITTCYYYGLIYNIYGGVYYPYVWVEKHEII